MKQSRIYWTYANGLILVYRRKGDHLFYLDEFGELNGPAMRYYYPSARFDWRGFFESLLGLKNEASYSVHIDPNSPRS